MAGQFASFAHSWDEQWTPFGPSPITDLVGGPSGRSAWMVHIPHAAKIVGHATHSGRSTGNTTHYTEVFACDLKLEAHFCRWIQDHFPAKVLHSIFQLHNALADKMIKLLICLCLCTAVTIASSPQLGIKFDKRDDGLPILTLPYATYRAASFNPDGDIYVFKNIRFAAPPVGDLRWAKPAPPTPEPGIQDGSYGPICVQAPLKGPQLTGPGADSPIGEALNQFLAGIPVPSLLKASEDCLFLDIYVPKKAIDNPSLKLPVISWFYGGAYIFRAKDQAEPILPFYDGTGLLQQSGSNVIFVASNYRMGAYGFLAGRTMEKTGLPNAGLHDQRAALQWIQDYIGLVGGDKSQVSAWGLSAGAGSILHQLVAFGGTQDPLFSRAVIQSPAFQFTFDRRGTLEETFQNFTKLAGCAGQGVACLRAASAETLDKANKELNTD
ncbi:MAG: hypothetical protein Q9226_007047, partial [Calogaya cf. arnoldii]